MRQVNNIHYSMLAVKVVSSARDETVALFCYWIIIYGENIQNRSENTPLRYSRFNFHKAIFWFPISLALLAVGWAFVQDFIDFLRVVEK